MQTFFDQIDPSTGFAFVVIQHLSSDHESPMDGLLSRHTALPITVVEKPVALLANHIYLIPSQHNAVATEGQLLPSPKEKKPAINLPVDTFFHSLAEAYQERAIGIVLSGSGTDGSRGVKHIKEHGGMVMVQTPSTAKFDGMPRATVNAVAVDFNLPVADLVQAVNRLAEEFSVAVSSFFRDPPVWEVFRQEVVDDLFSGRKAGEPVRVWVPACSTGEEAYTIAILLNEYQEKHRHADFKIFASDIDKKALARAEAGVFSESITHEVDPLWLEKYFDKIPQPGYRAKKKIRERIVFSEHDLTTDPSFIRMDLISCRNVLTYLKPEGQQRILENFRYALNYQGYLVLGANESLGSVQEAFRTVAPRTNIFQIEFVPVKQPTETSLSLNKEKIGETTASGNDISNLLTSTNVATIFLDENLIVRLITPRSEEIVNIRQKDIGQSFTNFTTRLKRDTLETVIRKVQSTGKPVRREVSTRDGKHYFNQVLPYRVGNEATQGVVITFVDISDFKKARAARLSAERKTKEAVRRLEMVIESLKVGIWEWVPSTDQTDWNQHMRGLFDISSDEFDGSFTSCLARIHSDDQARVRKAFQQTAEDENPLNIEFRVLWKDRSVHYIYAQGRVVTTANKETSPSRMVGTCVDRTQRKMAEEAALQYGQLLESSHNEIYICDARTLRFINVNRGARENIGYTLEEMSALTLLDIAPEVSRQQFQELTQTLDEQPEENIQFDTTHQRRDGSHYHVLANLQQMQYNGRPVFILIVLDITERAIFNAQLKETNRQLKVANEYLDNFVFMAAHDLRAPVANLLSLVQLLEESNPDDTRIVSKIGISVARLESTLNGLIKILNIQQYGQDEATMLSVEDVYHTITNRLSRQIKEAAPQLITDFSAPTFYYIAPYLESILHNLLSNALKYRSEDRPLRVEVRTRTEEDYLVLTVADNGSGIDLERYHEKLFKPFERLNRQASGQGIGMHLVKTMVEKNGGRIEVESKPNRGTTFHIYLHTYEQKRPYATNSIY